TRSGCVGSPSTSSADVIDLGGADRGVDGPAGAGNVENMQLGAEAVEALRVPLRATNDLAQAVGAGQLDLRQGDEPRPDRQPAEPEVGAVLFDQAFELGPQQKLQKLVEHALLGPHGIAF